MCDHAHIQLEKEFSNTDFICSTTCVAGGKRIFSSYNIDEMVRFLGFLMGVFGM